MMMMMKCGNVMKTWSRSLSVGTGGFPRTIPIKIGRGSPRSFHFKIGGFHSKVGGGESHTFNPSKTRRKLHVKERGESGVPPSNFYDNRVVESYAARDTNTVSLRQLCIFGRTLSEEKILRSANYIREELPIRLAHRIIRFQQLPFIVGANPHIEDVYQLYWKAFETFRQVPLIKTLDENEDFCVLLQKMLDIHLSAIPHLAIGVGEAHVHLKPLAADRFMNETLRSRIGRRVLAEQHVALSDSFVNRFDLEKSDWIGVVNTACEATGIVQKCIDLAYSWFKSVYPEYKIPSIVVDGYSPQFTYIPEHLEYILYELLKNSLRFTHEHAFAQRLDPPSVLVTIGQAENTIMFRVSDQGGGIESSIRNDIWSYSHTSKKKYLHFDQMPSHYGARIGELKELPPTLHLGLGLPMARVYAEYWGGSISIYSMDGYGTDVYVTISIGNQSENLFYTDPE